MVRVMGLERVADDGFTSTSRRWMAKQRPVVSAAFSWALFGGGGVGQDPGFKFSPGPPGAAVSHDVP